VAQKGALHFVGREEKKKKQQAKENDKIGNGGRRRLRDRAEPTASRKGGLGSGLFSCFKKEERKKE